MAKKNEKPKCISVGGQAVMEGVMMQGPEKTALAVRRPDGKVALKIEPVKKLSDKYPILGWPIIRGVVNFVAQLASGMKMLMASAEMAGMDEEEPSEFDKKVAKILHMKAEDVMMIYAVALAIVMVIGLFFVVPTAVESLLKWLSVENKFVLNLTGGVLRMAMFLAYVALASRMKEIKRVFMYHGAEHKSIYCFEAGKELNVENAQTFTTLHPRCGTSFLVIVFTISILIFTFLGTDSGNVFLRVGSRLLLLPVTAGVSYEILKWLGRAEDTPLVRALKWPGLMVQKLTTKQPDDDMVEVALIALKAALGMENALPKELDPDYVPEEKPEEAAE